MNISNVLQKYIWERTTRNSKYLEKFNVNINKYFSFFFKYTFCNHNNGVIIFFFFKIRYIVDTSVTYLIVMVRSPCPLHCFSTSMWAPVAPLMALILLPPRPITLLIAFNGTDTFLDLRGELLVRYLYKHQSD